MIVMNSRFLHKTGAVIALFLMSMPLVAHAHAPAQTFTEGGMGEGWWIWPLALFFVSIAVGFLAVVSGTGGGVLFVPFVAGLFPFHLDFIRGTGLMVALCAALAAGPGMLARNMASLRLAIPFGLVASTASIFGAMLGLALPVNVVQFSMGICIMVICVVMIRVHNADYPDLPGKDALAAALSLNGLYTEDSSGETIQWRVIRTPAGLCIFALIGFLAGVFGIGGGWAMVPTLNLVMGAPLKLSVATGKIILGVTDTSAAWVYLNRGGIMAMIAVPSILGAMLGSAIGVRVFSRIKPKVIRWVVILALLLAGLRAIARGVGV